MITFSFNILEGVLRLDINNLDNILVLVDDVIFVIFDVIFVF